MSDTKRRSRRSGAGTIQMESEVRRIGADGKKSPRKRQGFLRTVALLCGALVIAAFIFGCGSSEPIGPVAASSQIDASLTTASRGVRDAYATAEAALADAIIDRGGALQVKAFRGGAVELARLEGDPAVSSARRRRDLEATGSLSALGSMIGETLGLVKPSPELQAKLDTLLPGSAVAAALRLAVEDVKEAPGDRFALVLSDGRDNVLPDGVRDDDASSSPRALAQILAQELEGVDASGITVVMGGVGQGLPAAAATRLIEAWRLACQATQAARCVVDADAGVVTETLK
jgi:hypothetical protein